MMTLVHVFIDTVLKYNVVNAIYDTILFIIIIIIIPDFVNFYNTLLYMFDKKKNRVYSLPACSYINSLVNFSKTNDNDNYPKNYMTHNYG